jgi:hypothetical protein
VSLPKEKRHVLLLGCGHCFSIKEEISRLMRKTYIKIVGFGLIIAMLASLIVGILPVSAMSQPRVVLIASGTSNANQISANAVYQITYVSYIYIPTNGTIVVEMPAGTIINAGLLAADVTIQTSFGVKDDLSVTLPFSGNPAAVAVSADQTKLTIILAAAQEIGINSAVRLTVGSTLTPYRAITNPSAPGTYVLIVTASKENPSLGTETSASAAYNIIDASPLAIFRQGGTWFIDTNGNGAFDIGDWSNSPNTFGQSAGDIPLAIDWNGDGVQELAIFRPGGTWFIDMDHNGAFDPLFDWSNSPNTFGRNAGDIPLAIDWNGDGVQDLAIFRQGGTWFIDTNHNGAFEAGVDWSNSPNTFGRNTGDVPLAMDWNEDGIQELAIFRQGGTWFIDTNHNGAFDSGVDWTNAPNTFGRNEDDLPLAVDWNIN